MSTVTRTKTWLSGDVLTAADLNAEFDNLLGALALVNADISAGAAIAYSKLSLTGSILNADLAGSIDASKISGTALVSSALDTDTALTANSDVKIATQKAIKAYVDALPTATSTTTLTNKRITKRVSTTADSATPTPNADTDDIYTVTALAQAATFGAPTGTPTNGQTLVIRVLDNGTARALSFNAIYRFSTDIPAPTTTVLSKTIYIGFIYNSAASKWDCLAVVNNF